jgi:hypothetical protein
VVRLSSPSASGSASTAPRASAHGERVLEAIEATLAEPGAHVALDVTRTRGDEAAEVLLTGDGIIEPAADRGRMVYDLTTLLEVPGASPGPLDRPGVAWDDERFWVRGSSEAAEWETRDREEAREVGGLLGRLPDGPLGVLRAATHADAREIEALPPDPDHPSAERYLVNVPLDAAEAQGVPADTPYAALLRDTYAIDALPLEVSFENGAIARVRYTLRREETPLGGPDEVTTTYDWRVDPSARVELPPAD